MLGWEYPPHISGGLGTACEGLTTALSGYNVDIDFVVPRVFGDENTEHIRLLGALYSQSNPDHVPRPAKPTAARRDEPIAGEQSVAQTTPTTTTYAIPSLLSPYLNEVEYAAVFEQRLSDSPGELALAQTNTEAMVVEHEANRPSAARPHYGRDLFAEVARFSGAAVHATRAGHYDLVHAHDWMTFPAGLRIASEHDIPLITHVHSLEFDRAGHGGNPKITAVERAGVDGSKRVVAVSYYTRGLVHRIHDVSLDKIEVVHNGVYTQQTVQAYQTERRTTGPVVLFLGRITFQKGPEYFVKAASKVLEHVPDAKFVMAGSGDMLPRMKRLAADLGIADAFRFPGFVTGADLERTFSTADVYVMPSVSEPFGIAPLEAMSYDRPVIVSKQSGVSEVLKHALKVDFWDVDKIASQIVALLELPELRELIVAQAREEIRHIHWEAAAQKLLPIYEQTINT